MAAVLVVEKLVPVLAHTKKVVMERNTKSEILRSSSTGNSFDPTEGISFKNYCGEYHEFLIKCSARMFIAMSSGFTFDDNSEYFNIIDFIIISLDL